MDLLARMAAEAGGLLKGRKQTVAVAETSAGGLVSSALLAVPGASAYYAGGGVLYTYDSRSILLGLPEDAFEGMRPCTEEYAARLAEAVRHRLGATWGVSETGGRRSLRKQIWGCAGTFVHGRLRPDEQADNAGDGQCGPGGEHVGVRPGGARFAERGGQTKLRI